MESRPDEVRSEREGNVGCPLIDYQNIFSKTFEFILEKRHNITSFVLAVHG